jgi:hypothetical protein
MRRIDFSKVFFYITTVSVLLGATFLFGLYSGVKENDVYRAVRFLKTTVGESLNITSKEVGTITGTHPDHFLQPARQDGNGVTINTVPDDGRLILLSGFFDGNNGLRLIRRDGTVVHHWTVKFYDIFPDPKHAPIKPATNWNVDTHGALALSDGSVVFNFEYYGLVKLDRCGRTVWALPALSHHSVERAEGGGFWVPGRKHHPEGSDSPYPPFIPPFDADTIMHVTEEGGLIDEIPVPQLFYDNGLEAVLTATGEWLTRKRQWDKEIVHLNKIAELPRAIAGDFPMFEAGDLILSFRTLNMLMVIDPATRRIKWWQEGPWIRQHDPEFRPGGTIVLFNNNTYATTWGDADHTVPISPQHASNIQEYDPLTGASRVIYGADTKTQGMLSVIRGKVDLTKNGGLLVTEFEGGRVFETDAEGHIVWEYVNRYDSDEVAEISEARLYEADYFGVTDWSCP